MNPPSVGRRRNHVADQRLVRVDIGHVDIEDIFRLNCIRTPGEREREFVDSPRMCIDRLRNRCSGRTRQFQMLCLFRRPAEDPSLYFEFGTFVQSPAGNRVVK